MQVNASLYNIIGTCQLIYMLSALKTIILSIFVSNHSNFNILKILDSSEVTAGRYSGFYRKNDFF